MTHAEAWDQIPWLINGSLDEATSVRLHDHLHHCAACREEVGMQRALLQAMTAAPRVEAMPPASLQKLWDRIDADHPAAASRAGSPDMRSPASRYRVAAVAVLGLLAGAASMFMIQQLDGERQGAYRAVSDVTALVHGDLRVVFDGGMTLQQMQALLERTGMQVIAGPSASGVYTLSGGEAGSALELLRADPQVRFAEPVSPGVPRP
jgi:hypothetical protein